jgi:multicomponent Na+:H+ antiporter subunit G
MLLNYFGIAAIYAGAFFFFSGTVGLLRFPDPLSRLMPRAESPLSAFKLILIWILVLLSGASTAQLIGRALRRGRK